MKVPEVAARLRALAAERGIPELSVLADHLRRRPAVRRAAPSSTPMTDATARAIRAYAAAFPLAPLTGIARTFNVNPGRVSEALRGKRA